MNHDSARRGIEALFQGQGRKRAELRAHLDGCLECRAFYDRTARAFRALSGRPEEMTPEELWLFEPELPEAPAPRRTSAAALWGGLATLAAVSLLVVVTQGPPELVPRGGERPELKPAGRAFCARDGAGPLEAEKGGCQEGDRLLFALAGQGQRHAAVVVLWGERAEVVVAGAEGALSGEPETVLGQASRWRAGATAVAIFAAAPIAPGDAEQCARGECAKGLERAPIALIPPGPP